MNPNDINDRCCVWKQLEMSQGHFDVKVAGSTILTEWNPKETQNPITYNHVGGCPEAWKECE